MLNTRLKNCRKLMNLSQETVADLMALSRQAIVHIESGDRKVSTDELVRFADIYGVTANYLLYGDEDTKDQVRAYARTFNELSKKDQDEIFNLIDFKRRYKDRVNE